jgi:hypothetical protein
LPSVLDKPAPTNGGVNAYLCEGVSCSAPVGDLERLKAMLPAGAGMPRPIPRHT